MRQDVLIVDGYNIIGDWPELQQLKMKNLALARDALLERMSEYQAQTKARVIIVFDAYMREGIETHGKYRNIEVVFTRENEIADERIEKLVTEMNDRRTNIHVATSDATEQWVIFGKGASRMSARELQLAYEQMGSNVTTRVRKIQRTPQRMTTSDRIDDQTKQQLEKMRRGFFE